MLSYNVSGECAAAKAAANASSEPTTATAATGHFDAGPAAHAVGGRGAISNDVQNRPASMATQPSVVNRPAAPSTSPHVTTRANAMTPARTTRAAGSPGAGT